MIIKDIFVTSKEPLEECLIRELLQHQISYVKIMDEFHFLDRVYRFHDYPEKESILTLDKEDLIPVSNFFKNQPENEYFPALEQDFRKEHKKEIKENNRLIKEKIKRINKIS